MGEVFRATDTRLGRAVAIKVSAEHFSERFEREAKVVTCETKIQDLHAAFAGNQNVVRFQVAVHKPGMVRRRHAFGDLDRNVQQFACIGHRSGWRTVDVLHHEVIRPDGV